ncbi:sensor histidine kinase [Leifsonia bigeumensis]|uniref:Sensor histidine kinase n=1 Tax=Leifsonella bigeumensis TaxID=433643 RepID=A0ABP7G0J9_9MICO
MTESDATHGGDRPSAAPSLTPMFLAMRIALHTLVVLLTIFVAVRSAIAPPVHASWVIALSIVLLTTYVGGAFLARTGVGRGVQLLWLALVTLEGLTLAVLTPDAAFLVFPLFFLQLHLLAPRWAIAAVAASTIVTVLALSLHIGWSISGMLGPTIGAAVAVVIGLGYRALYRQNEERQALIDELLTTRVALAVRERETGVLEERSRLAREIHDTVAQGLSSIQLLLHAAERDGVADGALDHVRLARATAAEGLAETRRFIRELAPPALDGQSLPDALSRLAESASRDGLTATLHLSGEPTALTMSLETTLLRIAQASLANVAQHAQATRAELTLTMLDDWVGLDIVDDGRGFDPRAVVERGSFGLRALRERVEAQGGTLTIESGPDRGTAIAVSFPIAEAS